MKNPQDEQNEIQSNSRTSSRITMGKTTYFQFDWREFACGWGAAVANITATYPMYKIIFRQMLHGNTATSAFIEIKNEGFRFLYRGMLPPLAQKTVSLSIMFGVYDGTRRPLVETFNMNPYFAKIIAGCVAGSVESALMPFERIQTLLADSTYHSNFRNTQTAFKYVLVNYGFRELYRGMVPILIRNGPSNSMFFILREEISDILPRRDKALSRGVQEFLSGACIGAFTSTLFYPLNVLKVHVQCSLGGPYLNIFTVFKKIYIERGGKISHFYKGGGINLYRSFISWGLINTSYDFFKSYCF